MAAYAGRRGGDEKEVEAALYVVNLKVWKIDFQVVSSRAGSRILLLKTVLKYGHGPGPLYP